MGKVLPLKMVEALNRRSRINGVLYYGVFGTFPIQTPIASGWTQVTQNQQTTVLHGQPLMQLISETIPALSKIRQTL
ncbi:MAG: hypothetical protein IPG53_13275 [Ignavibacteriales bacterium]|nr:hypothetical protein [Ignavibacteriales bacterium]